MESCTHRPNFVPPAMITDKIQVKCYQYVFDINFYQYFTTPCFKSDKEPSQAS